MMLKTGLEGESMTGSCGGPAKHSVRRGSPADLKSASGCTPLPGKEANDGRVYQLRLPKGQEQEWW